MTAHRFIDRETGKPISEKQLHDEVIAILREAWASENRWGHSDTPPSHGPFNRAGVDRPPPRHG